MDVRCEATVATSELLSRPASVLTEVERIVGTPLGHVGADVDRPLAGRTDIDVGLRLPRLDINAIVATLEAVGDHLPLLAGVFVCDLAAASPNQVSSDEEAGGGVEFDRVRRSPCSFTHALIFARHPSPTPLVLPRPS